jgi:subtilase family serine protease
VHRLRTPICPQELPALRLPTRHTAARGGTGAGRCQGQAARRGRCCGAATGTAWVARAGGYRRLVRYASGDDPARKGSRVAAFLGIWAVALGLAVGLAGCSGGGAHPPASGAGRVSRAAVAPGGGLSPAQAWAAYDLAPLIRAGIDGRGQTIAIVDPFGSPTIAHDAAVFDKRFGLPPLSLRVIQPAGAVRRHGSAAAQTGAAGETTLDVEWAHTMAPGAKILLVETPAAEIEGRSGFPPIIKAEKYVIRHHLATVISQSFGATEPTFRSSAVIRALRGAYLLAAKPAYRVTVVASTGDSGAAGQTYSTRTYFATPEVSWPASDPMVTAVGGTQLAPAGDATPRRPGRAWSGSGGGRSAVFTRPAYQNGVADVVGQQRGIPDISMDASCASAAAIYGNNSGSPSDPSSWSTACGTSLAAPMFAGIVALAAQQAGRTLGAINPALYRMAAGHASGIVDVVHGNNTFTFSSYGQTHVVPGFHAQPGYDLVSGLGTIDAAQFVPELAKAAG